jgi:DNA ligase (NAD+)
MKILQHNELEEPLPKISKLVVHEYRMYSLDNSYSIEDLKDWENRIQKVLGNVPLAIYLRIKI